jgi:hypothetical protein
MAWECPRYPSLKDSGREFFARAMLWYDPGILNPWKRGQSLLHFSFSIWPNSFGVPNTRYVREKKEMSWMYIHAALRCAENLFNG